VGTIGLSLHALRAASSKAKEAAPVTAKDSPRISAWLRRADAEAKTADLLSKLSKGYQVFHDLSIPKQEGSLAHFVSGPSGFVMLASVTTDGQVTETIREGFVVPGVDLGTVTAVLMQQRRRLARVLKLREKDLDLAIVVHSDKAGVVPADLRKTLAVYEQGAGELPTGQVWLWSADALLPSIDTGIEVWSKHARDAVSLRARMRLTPAFTPVDVAASVVPAMIASLDADGNAQQVTPAVPDTSWMESGVKVDITTTQGVLTALRIVAAPYRDKSSVVVVPLCVEEEWVTAEREGRAPTAHAYPVYAVTPAE
jgi:hypothetical protein